MRKWFYNSVKTKLHLSYILFAILIIVAIYVQLYGVVKNIVVSERKNDIIRVGAYLLQHYEPYFAKADFNFSEKELLTMKKEAFNRDMRFFILGRDGVVKFDILGEYKSAKFDGIPEIKDAILGNTVCNYVDANGTKLIYYASPFYDRTDLAGVIFISASADFIDAAMTYFSKRYLIIASILFTLSVGVSYIMANSAMQPVSELANDINMAVSGGKRRELILYDDDQISALRRYYNLMLSQKMLADESIGYFISNLSHEIKTPITAIKLLSDLVETSSSENADDYKDFVKGINEEIDYLTRILESLVSVSKIDREDLELNPEMVDIRKLIQDRVSCLKNMADKKHIDLSITSLAAVKSVVDKTKISQMIDNLITNAIKYTNENGEVKVSLSQRKNNFVIEVEDNGIGIGEKDQLYIFNRYYMAEQSRKRDQGSSGLGLYIVRQIVTLHLGTVEVNSELGKGSLFRVIIPITKA